MKLRGYAVIFMALIVMGQVSLSTTGHGADSGLPVLQSGVSDQLQPLLFGVHLDGKRLVVEGANFDSGAAIRIDDKRKKTEADIDSPGMVLFSKKAGKKIIINDETVTVQVQNGDGQRSNIAYLYKPNSFPARLIIFGLQPELGLIHLKTNEYLLIQSALPSRDKVNPFFFTRIITSGPPFNTDEFRLYSANHPGDTVFETTQILFNDGSDPPPPIILRLTIHIE